MFKQIFTVTLALTASAVIANFSEAALIFSINATGSQEVPGPGDSDGLATGFLTINQASDANPLGVSWNISYSNIVVPTAMHIHTGALGVSGSVFLNLGIATSGGAGTLISSTNFASPANRDSVLANPSGFYVNIHNSAHPSGAVRGQLTAVPEPCSLIIVGLATLVGYSCRRRS
jgi:hypothetical protein